MQRKLGTASDFVKRAKELGVDLFLGDVAGLHVYWNYIGTTEAVTEVKRVFKAEGITAVHHFNKKPLPKAGRRK